MKKSEVFVFASAHGRWRALPVHVAKVLVPTPVGVQNDTIERVEDLDVSTCVPRRGW